MLNCAKCHVTNHVINPKYTNMLVRELYTIRDSYDDSILSTTEMSQLIECTVLVKLLCIHIKVRFTSLTDR